LASKVGLVGIVRIVFVEAVRQNGGLPQTIFFSVPNRGDAADRALTELPTRIQPLCGGNRPIFRGDGSHSCGTNGSGKEGDGS
jgi:hypothetical protein